MKFRKSVTSRRRKVVPSLIAALYFSNPSSGNKPPPRNMNFKNAEIVKRRAQCGVTPSNYIEAAGSDTSLLSKTNKL